MSYASSHLPLEDSHLDHDASLAGLGSRLGARIVDGLLWVVSTLPATLLMVVASYALGEGCNPDIMEKHPNLELPAGAVALFGWLVLAIGQWFLVVERGQTVGKMLLHIRIVRTNGGPVDFGSGVVMRSWILGLASGFMGAFCLGWLVNLADGMLIMRTDRRCLHDHLAGTKVVEAWYNPYVKESSTDWRPGSSLPASNVGAPEPMHDAFAPPSTDYTAVCGEDTDELLASVSPHVVATLAMGSVMVAGVVSAVAALQVYAAVWILTWVKVVPLLFGLLGVAATVVGGMIGRGRLWASAAGAALTFVLTSLELFWVVYALVNGFFAPLQLFALTSSGLGFVLALSSIGPNRRTTIARAKLVA